MTRSGRPSQCPAERSCQTDSFLATRQDPKDEGELVRKLLKQRIEEEKILQRMPKDLAALFQTAEAAPTQAGDRPPSAIA